MTTVTGAPEEAIQGFRAAMQGQVLVPGSDGYDTARSIWNAMIDRRPALIARCQGASDVMTAVRFAREHGLLISVRGGGHNVSGNAICDDGLMIDLSAMKGIRVDPATLTARAEPGVLWGEFDHETQAFGLATVGGVVATTGIAGLTLGGGQGWLTGKYGLTVDNLLSADVVTADGQLLKASASENVDLFWGLRGAGANLGIATSLEYRLHPISTVLGGLLVYSFERAREVLRFYREFGASQPDDLTTYAAVLTGPDGNLVVALVPCYAGPLELGEKVLAPLRQFGPPAADTTSPMPYVAMQAMMGASFPAGRQNYWKSGLTNEISDAAIDVLVDHCAQIPSPFSAVAIADCHGAYSRVGSGETAYFHRDLQYDVSILSSWISPDDSEENLRWTREFYEDLQPHLARGVYVNDLDRDEAQDRVRNAYGGNYDRLVALKAKYDPTNFFRMNQNIRAS